MYNYEIREMSDEDVSEYPPSSLPYQSEFYGDHFGSEYSDASDSSEYRITKGINRSYMDQIGLFQGPTEDESGRKFSFDKLGT